MMRIATSILLLSFAAAAQQDTLAIASVENRGGAGSDQAALVGDAITGTLVKDNKLRLVERAKLATVMKEQLLVSSGVMSDEVQIKVASLTGARFLFAGWVQRDGSTYSVGGNVMDSSTAQLVFSDSLKVGTVDQLTAGARQFARMLQDKLTGSNSAVAQGESVGDFDPVMVKEAARRFARTVAARFPRITGKLREVLPTNSSSCSLSDSKSAFAGQLFEIGGTDSVTGQLQHKGTFQLRLIDGNGGCSGAFIAGKMAPVEDGDSLTSVPLAVSMDPLRNGPGTDAQVAKAFSEEARESLKSQAAFVVSDKPLVTLVGSISGTKTNQLIDVQAMDKRGTALEHWQLNERFGRNAPPPEATRVVYVQPSALPPVQPAPQQAYAPPPPAYAPPPQSRVARAEPPSGCLSSDSANRFVDACITAVNTDDARVRMQVTLTNKTGDRLHVLSDGRTQQCGAVVTDALGTVYAADAGWGNPECGIPQGNGNPATPSVRTYIVDHGVLIEPGKSIIRTYSARGTGAFQNAGTWNFELNLYVASEGQDSTRTETAGFSMPGIRKAR
jgi:hypothetical protein